MTSSNRAQILRILVKNGQYLMRNYVLKQSDLSKIDDYTRVSKFQGLSNALVQTVSILFMVQFRFQLRYLKEERTSKNMRN